RMITGRKRTGSKWLVVTLASLFIIAVFGLFWVGGTIASDFRTTYRKTYPLTLNQPASDTLIIRQRDFYKGGEVEDGEIWDDNNDGIHFRDDNTIAINNIALRITNSPDSLYHLSVQKCANGKNSQRAMELATPLVFDYRQEGDILYLPKDFVLPKGTPFRAQKLRVEIQVPVGKVFMTENLNNHFSDRTFVVSPGRFRYRDIDYHDWDDNEYYKMTIKGPVGGAKDDDDDQSSNTDRDDNKNTSAADN
ncbi:MAG TPA: hypothetical protein VFS31_09700, partial [Chitinophagaceae bacterium]|nr:hypothetical protein [Chitinophagaceae bacterium]